MDAWLSHKSGWLPLISSRFFLLPAWLIAPRRQSGPQYVKVFHTVVYHCLPTICCWIHMLGISLPPLLRAVEYLVMDVWADLLRFGTLSQNPFENEGLDWFELNNDHNLTKSLQKITPIKDRMSYVRTNATQQSLLKYQKKIRSSTTTTTTTTTTITTTTTTTNNNNNNSNNNNNNNNNNHPPLPACGESSHWGAASNNSSVKFYADPRVEPLVPWTFWHPTWPERFVEIFPSPQKTRTRKWILGIFVSCFCGRNQRMYECESKLGKIFLYEHVLWKDQTFHFMLCCFFKKSHWWMTWHMYVFLLVRNHECQSQSAQEPAGNTCVNPIYAPHFLPSTGLSPQKCSKSSSPSKTRWWQLKYFISSPLFGGRWTQIWFIFFRWVGSTTN